MFNYTQNKEDIRGMVLLFLSLFLFLVFIWGMIPVPYVLAFVGAGTLPPKFLD